MPNPLKMRSLALLFTLLLFASGGLVFSAGGVQQPTKKAPAPASAIPDSQKKNIEEYIQLLREDVRQQKAQITGAVMQLSPEDAQKFWPIYEEYQAALIELNDSRIQNLKNFASADLTDEMADQSIKEELSLRRERDELMGRFYGRVKQSLGALTAARFLLIESQLQLITDLQLDSMLPTEE